MRVEALARAKINLGLSVLGRRSDGYHDLASVMQTVELTDHLTLRPAEAIEVSFHAGPGFEGAMPEPPDLVERAIAAFASAPPAGEPGHARARVVKRIPLAAGLAGGSADAAAALLAMNALAGRPRSEEELSRMCERLGSDVPFALRGATALVTGRGERLRDLPCPTRLWWVLGIPALSISTAGAYRRHDQLAGRRAPRARDDAEAGLVAGLASGSPEAVAASLYNDLELAAFDLEPSLPGLKRHMLEAGALGAVVSGSGPTVAGLCADRAHAEAVQIRVARRFARVEVAPSARAGAEILRAGPGDGMGSQCSMPTTLGNDLDRHAWPGPPPA